METGDYLKYFGIICKQKVVWVIDTAGQIIDVYYIYERLPRDTNGVGAGPKQSC